MIGVIKEQIGKHGLTGEPFIDRGIQKFRITTAKGKPVGVVKVTEDAEVLKARIAAAINEAFKEPAMKQEQDGKEG